MRWPRMVQLAAGHRATSLPVPALDCHKNGHCSGCPAGREQCLPNTCAGKRGTPAEPVVSVAAVVDACMNK